MQAITTLDNVKTWLAIPDNMPGADKILSMLITRVSSQVLAYLERGSFVSQTYTDYFNGHNTTSLFVNRWPVTNIESLFIGTQKVPYVGVASNSGIPQGRGYTYNVWDGTPPGDLQQVKLCGYVFPQSQMQICMTYTAGYLAVESYTISGNSQSVAMPYGIWIADNGIVNSSGTPFVLVDSDPAAGQYAIDPATNGNYLFNIADIGTTVAISYSWCPYAVEEVAMEWIEEVYKRRGTAGQSSRNLAGQESTTLTMKAGVPTWVASALQNFKLMLPI